MEASEREKERERERESLFFHRLISSAMSGAKTKTTTRSDTELYLALSFVSIDFLRSKWQNNGSAHCHTRINLSLIKFAESH